MKLLLIVLLSAASVLAQTATRARIAALYAKQAQVKSISQVALSPNGKRVVWSVYEPQSGAHVVYVAAVQQPGDRTRITAALRAQACNEEEPVWSHDSEQLAFLSDCATPGQSELFVEDFGHGSPRQLTHLKGALSDPQWSPDSRAIALLFVDHASRAPTPMAAENKAVGVIDDLQNSDIQRLAVTALDIGSTREITPRNLYIFEYDWSPDGRNFAYTASAPPGDDNWYIAQLYTQACASDKPTVIYKPRFQIALPRWSPDGKSIAFIEGLMSDEGGTGGEIYLLPSNGGTPRDLTPGRPSSPSWFTWLANQTMLFSEFSGGSTGISTLDLASGHTNNLWQGGESIQAGSSESSISVARTATPFETALIRTSWSMLPEVWLGPVGHWKQFTRLNADVSLPLPRSQNVAWQRAGFPVQGWLLFPENYNPAKRYPMLVIVHGGPAWIATPTWRAPDFDTTLFTNFGYFVFFPNARGSYGQGEQFTKAARRDWGFGDLADILAGVDAVASRVPLEGNRIGILGWSYGGSMAMMAGTQTNRFRAAVAGAGAANWQSYYGQNSIDKWMLSYFGGSVYDDPAAYRKCSAITYIKNDKTPTLVLVGERDGEAPPAQSFEFWHALKELHTPTRLVVYPGEGHDFYKQSDQIDVTARTLEWFDRYLPPNP